MRLGRCNKESTTASQDFPPPLFFQHPSVAWGGVCSSSAPGQLLAACSLNVRAISIAVSFPVCLVDTFFSSDLGQLDNSIPFILSQVSVPVQFQFEECGFTYPQMHSCFFAVCHSGQNHPMILEMFSQTLDFRCTMGQQLSLHLRMGPWATHTASLCWGG